VKVQLPQSEALFFQSLAPDLPGFSHVSYF
jgi:hypothetical protein